MSEPALRTPQASKLRARVDVAFRLITDPDGQLFEILDVPCSAVDWTRNAPAVADTSEVTLPGDALPFDLRVIADKSMFASVWLYEQDAPDFTPGGRGHFFGVVDTVKRERYGLQRTRLSCRDLTAVPLGARMPEAAVKAFAIEPGASIASVVEQLLRQIPGTFQWRVESRTAVGDTPVVPIVEPRPSRSGSRSVSKTKQRDKAFLADIVGAERMTVWAAISGFCARFGVVPEVMMGVDQNPVVVLANATDLHTSDVLRPFPERNGRKWRVFVDGDGIQSLSESLDLSTGEHRPDFVEVGSRVAGTGRVVSARWPQTSQSADEGKDAGLFQWVDSFDSLDALRGIARAGYESLAHNQYTVSLTLAEPWSAGGGPRDPDLLDLGFGAAVEIVQPALDATKLTASEVFARRTRWPAAMIQALVEAHRRVAALSLLFQCAEVRHSWSAGDYTCTIGLRQFLGRESAPMFSGDTPRLTDAARVA